MRNLKFTPAAWPCLLLASTLFAAESGQAPTPLDPDHAAKMKQGIEVFQTVVRPVFIGRCLKCHGGEKTEANFNLNTRDGLLKGGQEGPAVTLGKGTSSRLYKLVAHLEEPHMPEDGVKLADQALTAIARWIDLGAPYDKPLASESQDPLAWTRRTLDPSARQFWSFQPLAQTSPPPVDDPWIRTPIDRFVLAKLQEHKLSPNAPAERRTLIRRAYFDLIGLPPSPDEVEQFVRDAAPDAYEKLVDRLLSSPHYGERWGRHWLDLARFAESHGFEQDYDRPHAYHYRDFVIQALNADLPYDQFVRWQLAGDELAPDNPQALMATGFLGAGVFPTQLTEREFEPARYDELDDMVATLGTTMLGLTVGCARCHDHKYDPIPSADYYRLISTFTAAIRSDVDVELDSAPTRAATRIWQQEQDRLAAALQVFEKEQLPGRFEQWLKTAPKVAAPQPAWIVLDLVEYKSRGGAALTKRDDGSLLASGPNPDFDSYTLVAHTHLTGITAIRLEALADASLVKGGPGRADNGNIGLSRFSVTATPLSGPGPSLAVKLQNPTATFQQNPGNLSISAALDNDPRSGWAVDPQFGKDHAAAFETAEEVGFPGGTKLTFQLDFDLNNRHNIGRPRLAISTRPRPVGLQDAAQNQTLIEVAAILDKVRGGQPAANPGIDVSRLTDRERESLSRWFRTTDPDWHKLNGLVHEHLAKKPQPQLTKVLVTSEGVKPIPHHADDRGFTHFLKETHFLRRGDTLQKQGVAPAGFLQVLTRSSHSPVDIAASRWHVAPPAGCRTSYRRRALAAWITDTEAGAGQLLARVQVNRLWQHHLGRGLVATPNDFGFQGARPTHPELLDWLAQRLIADGWHLKSLHKLLMTSAVYMQSAVQQPAAARLDPDNQWCWRHAPQRLEAELIRDALLAVSGELDRRQFGPGSLDEGMKRRSVYFMIKRSRIIPLLQLFDAPEPLVSQGQRPSTTIAPQALLFMNNPQVRSCARSLAKRLATAAEQSLEAAGTEAYRLTLARQPTAAELRDASDFLKAQLASYATDKQADGRELALADFCQVLMSLNEFVFIE